MTKAPNVKLSLLEDTNFSTITCILVDANYLRTPKSTGGAAIAWTEAWPTQPATVKVSPVALIRVILEMSPT